MPVVKNDNRNKRLYLLSFQLCSLATVKQTLNLHIRYSIYPWISTLLILVELFLIVDYKLMGNFVCFIVYISRIKLIYTEVLS